MKKLYMVLLFAPAFALMNNVLGQVTLSTSPYTENFDHIGSALPAGFSVLTGASNSSIGTAASFSTSPVAWNNTSGAFKNFASATIGSSANSATQQTATDRALGVRQTGSFGDPGASFTFQITNTTGKNSFKLTFDLQSLDVASPRITTWLVQYGLGDNPSVFTNANTVTGTMTTGGATFTNNNIVADFGNALDDQNSVVTIRIVTLGGTTGSGSRPSTALDNFSLSWIDDNSNTPQLSLTDASDNTVSSLAFPFIAMNTTSTLSYVLNGKNLTENVDINTTGAAFSISTDNSTFSTSLSIQPEDAVNKTIYIKFAPAAAGVFNGTIMHTSTGASEKDISLTGQAYDPSNLSFDFNTCINNGAPGSGFTEYSVTGAQVWACTTFGHNNTNGVNINGYSGGPNENEDWLISPKFDLSLYTAFPVLSFWSRGEFSGPSLSLWASTDYDGVGNPDNFTWTQLSANFPPLNNTWTLSDGIDLTAYKNTPVYIAFKYTSNNDDGAARWTIDDIAIKNQTQIFSAIPSFLYFGEQSAGTQSAGKTVVVQSVGYGDITVQAPAGFSVSLDNTTYASSVVISQASANSGATLYVQFAPASKQLIITDTLRFTNGSDLDTKAVALSGSSYPKSETLDAGCYNMSFFGSSGSSAIVRTPAQITAQIDNVATVFQHLNLDVAGFEEMSSDSSMNVMVSQLNTNTGQNYSALISDRYSYFFQEPDPTFPPQKIGILYNSATMTPSATEPPRAMFRKLYDDILDNTTTLTNYPGGNSSSFWASGRLPFLATFTTNIGGVSKKVRVIVIHAKAGADLTSYQRRQYDAQVLKDSIDAYYKNDNVIILGDFNDRLVTSITSGQVSSYEPFVLDNANYDPLTMPLDQAGQTSFPGDNGMIDQIIITNPLTPFYLLGSTQIEPANTYISPYNKVVASDHLPVYSRFDIQRIVPVTIIDFTGKVVGNAVKLNWNTSSETNSKQFMVQHSTDGIHFLNIGTISASGSENRGYNYQFTDINPSAGINFYRLVQEDLDGALSVHGTIRILFGESSGQSLQVYPNPVHGNASLTIRITNASGVYTATVFSMNGKSVLKVKGTIEQINQSINRGLQRLGSGIYLLDVGNATSRFQAKLIKH